MKGMSSMWKKLLLAFALLLYCHPGYASPLQDFSPGHMALDVNWKPDSFRGGKNNWDFSGTVGLDGRWALNYRQISFSPKFEGINLYTSNKELNLLYKIDPNIQLYAGYSITKGHETLSGRRLAQNNKVQGGIIAMKSLGQRTTLYTILGGGSDSANIEFGLSYQMKKNLELTATYRHLEFKRVGSQKCEEDFRGFGIGFTYKY
jgi:predicted porin